MEIGLDWLGSAIGGVANAVSSIFTGKANRKHQARENQKDREFNAEQAQISRDWQEEQYIKYESPAAQMQQMKSAGINPVQGVSSQSVGSGSTASASSSSLPQAQAPDFSFLGELNLMEKQIKGLKLDNEIKVQQDKKLEEETKSLQLDNKKKAIEANDWESYWQLTKEQLFRNNKKLAKDTEYVEEQKKKAHEEFRLARVNANNAEAAESVGINPIEDDHYLKDAQEYAALAQGDLSSAQEKLANKNISLTEKKVIYQDLLNHSQSVANIADDIFLGEERRANLDLLRTNQVSTELRMYIDTYLTVLEGYLASLKETDMWFNVRSKSDDIAIKKIETTIKGLKALLGRD